MMQQKWESVQGPMASERSKVRLLLDNAAACRVEDPVRARKLTLDARTLVRASCLAADEAEVLYLLASIAHQRGETDDAFALAADAVEVALHGTPSLTLAWSAHLLAVVHHQANDVG